MFGVLLHLTAMLLTQAYLLIPLLHGLAPCAPRQQAQTASCRSLPLKDGPWKLLLEPPSPCDAGSEFGVQQDVFPTRLCWQCHQVACGGGIPQPAAAWQWPAHYGHAYRDGRAAAAAGGAVRLLDWPHVRGILPVRAGGGRQRRGAAAAESSGEGSGDCRNRIPGVRRQLSHTSHAHLVPPAVSKLSCSLHAAATAFQKLRPSGAAAAAIARLLQQSLDAGCYFIGV